MHRLSILTACYSFALASCDCHETQPAFRPQMAGQRVVGLCRHPALILRTRPRDCSPARHHPEGGIRDTRLELPRRMPIEAGPPEGGRPRARLQGEMIPAAMFMPYFVRFCSICASSIRAREACDAAGYDAGGYEAGRSGEGRGRCRLLLAPLAAYRLHLQPGRSAAPREAEPGPRARLCREAVRRSFTSMEGIGARRSA